MSPDYKKGFARGLRAAIIIALGGKCDVRNCGVTDPQMLHVDHVHGGGTRERRVQKLAGTMYYYHLLRGIRKGKYRLLCANHSARDRARRVGR